MDNYKKLMIKNLTIYLVQTAHNTRLTLRCLFGGLGFRNARPVASLAPAHCSTHSFAALQNLRFRLFGLQNRRQS
ncbi:MAG: hypothetical protein LBH43_11705 [Treponema sp.]|jgi:hypothetical protein|nr:hypothetical protein [Treponema sp.]